MAFVLCVQLMSLSYTHLLHTFKQLRCDNPSTIKVINNFKLCNTVWILGFLLNYHNQWTLINVGNFSYISIYA